MRYKMMEFYAWIDAFEGQVFARFSNIHASDLYGIQEKIAMLHAKVCSIDECQVPFIPLVIPLFT